MLDKIKQIINKNKKDKNIYKEYIKCFCESEKAEELFKETEEFKNLKNSLLTYKLIVLKFNI